MPSYVSFQCLCMLLIDCLCVCMSLSVVRHVGQLVKTDNHFK